MDVQSKLKNLKDLFSKFVSLSGEINALHDSTVLRNETMTNSVASSNLIPRPTILPTKSSVNSAALGDYMSCLDFVSSDNGIDSGCVAISSAMFPTKYSVNSDALSDSMFGFDVDLSGNGIDNGYRNVSQDGSAILPIRSFVNSAVLNDSMRGFDFDSSGNGIDHGYRSASDVNSPALSDSISSFDFVPTSNGIESGYGNVSLHDSAMLPIKSSVNSTVLNVSMCAFDSSGNGIDHGYRSVSSVDGSAILPTKYSVNSAVSDSMCDFVSSGNGINSGYRNVTEGLNQVMGLEMQYSGFNETRLEWILNKKTSQTSMTNYFYYLLPDGNDANDTMDVIDSEIELLNVTESEVEPMTVGEFEVEPMTVGEFEAEPMTVGEFEVEPLNVVSSGSGFASAGDTTELECFDSGVIVVPTLKSSSLIVPPLNKLSSAPAPVVPEKCTITKRQSSPENKTAQPCYIDIKPHNGCDNINMFVPTSDVKAKKLCCAYCHKRYQKLARHLETVHKNEEDVKKFRELPKGSNERRNIISAIRSRGQFIWNTNAKLNGGELSTSRRPNKQFPKEAIEFNSCANCLGMFSDKLLRKHWNKCTNHALQGERIVKQLGHAVEGRSHPDACFDLRTKIFPKMIQTPSVRLIRFDWLLTEFGNDLCLNYSPHYQHKFIKQKLLNAGKLLFMAKSLSTEITDFASMYHVKHCNTVIEAIRTVSRFDLKAKQVGAPGTASALRTLVNAIGELLVIETMKRDDPEKERNVERFLKVFKKDARFKINKLVAITQSKLKRSKREDIPTTKDVNHLATYLDSKRDECFTELSKSYLYDWWLLLSQLTVASILVFSRKRVGEMQNILVTDYERREMFTEQNSSGTVPKETTDLVTSRMQIRGKLNRTVPVLLNHSFEECIDLLLLHRKDAGISDDNEYLFALPTKSGDIKVIDAYVTLKNFSDLCGAKNPGSLRGTKLRKHLASLCSTLNLSDNDVTNVTKFMGHSDKTHRDVYRHNPFEVEVVQMNKYLQIARGYNVNTGTSNVNIESEEPTSVDVEVTKRKEKQAEIGETKKKTKEIPRTKSNKKQEARNK